MNYFTFKQFARIINEEFGIHYSIKKKLTLKNRINARMSELGMTHYQEYIDLLSEKDSKELQQLANKITTNTTYFFREPEHFDFLRRVAFRDAMKAKFPMIRIWSAPCSEGHEPYSIAIEAAEFEKNNKGLNYKIYCSDLSEKALSRARNGIYPLDEISKIKKDHRQEYFDQQGEQFQISNTLKQKCSFYQLNFLSNNLKTQTKFDIIFCRNMLFYFKKEEQQIIINKLVERLLPGGYFIISRNESIHGLDVPLQKIEHSIFQKA